MGKKKFSEQNFLNISHKRIYLKIYQKIINENWGNKLRDCKPFSEKEGKDRSTVWLRDCIVNKWEKVERICDKSYFLFFPGYKNQ